MLRFLVTGSVATLAHTSDVSDNSLKRIAFQVHTVEEKKKKMEVIYKKITQKNDFFFLIFACPSIAFIYIGWQDLSAILFVGIGIACYGLAYFIVHEIIIHRRLPYLKNIKGNYITTIRRAHKVHHKTLHKYGATCFGMLIVPKKYWVK